MKFFLFNFFENFYFHQCLDVENSRDVTDNGVQYICMFKVKVNWQDWIIKKNIHEFLALLTEHLQLQSEC